MRPGRPGFCKVEMLFRQLPQPKAQERPDHDDRRAEPEWNCVMADNYLRVLKQTEKMAESKEREKERCDS